MQWDGIPEQKIPNVVHYNSQIPTYLVSCPGKTFNDIALQRCVVSACIDSNVTHTHTHVHARTVRCKCSTCIDFMCACMHW